MKMTASPAIGRKLVGAGTACVLAGGAGALMAAGTAQAAVKVMPACPAPVISGATATVTCSYTGAAQYWTVPAGVTQATFTLYGAAGGAGSNSWGYVGGVAGGGTGAEVTGTLRVTPGTVLQVNVGQAGAGSGTSFGGGGLAGDGGGGGGGASDIRDAAYRLAGRLLVAGGGGGGGADGQVLGGGGGDADSPGGTGGSAIGSCFETMSGGGGGGAGTASMGGAGGAGSVLSYLCQGTNSQAGSGAAGSKGSGGAGGQNPGSGGGGGGGGYYGGGGGGGQLSDDGAPAGAGGGGGGASYTGTATGASVNDAPASPPSANGEVIITYPEVLTSHSLSGHETAVSCLTASRCVAVGSRRGHGVVVTLRNGAQTHAAVLRGSSVIDSESCRTSGCWAIGHPVRGARAYLVKISSAGRPVAEQTLALPAGTALGSISCSSMTSCEIAGTDNRARPAAIEIGTWNGSRLHLYRRGVPGGTQVSMTAISCWHGDCEAVGSAHVGSSGRGLILTIAHGKPRTLNANSGYGLGSISCISAATCYAGGDVLVTVTRGVASNPQSVPGLSNFSGWAGIECHDGNCEAAGEYAPGSAAEGVLVSLTDGTAGSPVHGDGSGYYGIAVRGSSGFIAIGLGNDCTSGTCVGTVVTVG
jgi:hypothetical protein